MFMVLDVLVFSWSKLELKLITNNDNGNNIYNDDHINKVELRFLNSCFSSLRCCFWGFSHHQYKCDGHLPRLETIFG